MRNCNSTLVGNRDRLQVPPICLTMVWYTRQWFYECYGYCVVILNKSQMVRGFDPLYNLRANDYHPLRRSLGAICRSPRSDHSRLSTNPILVLLSFSLCICAAGSSFCSAAAMLIPSGFSCSMRWVFHWERQPCRFPVLCLRYDCFVVELSRPCCSALLWIYRFACSGFATVLLVVTGWSFGSTLMARFIRPFPHPR